MRWILWGGVNGASESYTCSSLFGAWLRCRSCRGYSHSDRRLNFCVSSGLYIHICLGDFGWIMEDSSIKGGETMTEQKQPTTDPYVESKIDEILVQVHFNQQDKRMQRDRLREIVQEIYQTGHEEGVKDASG